RGIAYSTSSCTGGMAMVRARSLRATLREGRKYAARTRALMAGIQDGARRESKSSAAKTTRFITRSSSQREKALKVEGDSVRRYRYTWMTSVCGSHQSFT